MGVTEIAAQVGLHKSSISRILATLEQERIVERDELSRKYRLGMGLIAIAGPLLANLDVRRVAFPALQDLAQATGETAALNIWDGFKSVTVEQIPSSKQVKHTSAMGSRYATALSASVQVFLAHEEESTVRALLMDGTVELDDSTEPSIDRYLDRLATVRDRGYACNFGEKRRPRKLELRPRSWTTEAGLSRRSWSRRPSTAYPTSTSPDWATPAWTPPQKLVSASDHRRDSEAAHSHAFPE